MALFYDTVHTVCARDYTEEQLCAWAPKEADPEKWATSFRSRVALVAAEGGEIVGFGDVDESGYLDRLYVCSDRQRRGIGTELCDRLEAAVKGDRVSVNVSLTAKAFFEARGYHTLKERYVLRNGVALFQAQMVKNLNSSS